MKKANSKNKQFLLLGMTLMVTAGFAGCTRVNLAADTVTLELGDKLSENVADYITDSASENAILDISGVDQTKVGTYDAAIIYNNKEYHFTVNVQDTTAPECEAVGYIYMQPGDLAVADLIKNVSDASKTESGIVSCEKNKNLNACDYTEMLDETAVMDNTTEYDKSAYKDMVSLEEEGCYKVTVQTIDVEGNFTNAGISIYVDGTAPELVQNVTEIEADASAVDAGKDDLMEILHTLPEVQGAEWAVAEDEFCQDNDISYEIEQKDFNLQGETPVETLSIMCSVSDKAGNISTEEFTASVVYKGLKSSDLAENTEKNDKKLEIQVADNKAANTEKLKQDSSTTLKQDTSSVQTTYLNGMTEEEFVAYMDKLYNENQDAYYALMFGEWDGTGEYTGSSSNEECAGYYESSYAQQVFAMVNQERVNNGLPELAWSSEMASYSDRRAMEITTSFSHDSAGGKMNVGENIAKGAVSPEMAMDGWMRSDGHRANILNANYTVISVSCYYDGNTYYWVQNFKH